MGSSGSTGTRKHTALGRSRFGGGTPALVAASVLVGLAITAGIVAVFFSLYPDANRVLAAAVFAALCLPTAVALGWALLVDRMTIRGATARPKDSVESHWLDKASAGAFLDVLVLTGVGSAILALTGTEISATFVCMAICIVAQLDCGVRYLLARARAA